MKSEEKDLLLKDICARLPYKVVIEHEGNLSVLDTIFMCDSISISSTSMDKRLSYNLDLDEIKPCLFPLSSMTEEQLYEVSQILGKDVAIFTDYLLTIDHCRRTFSYQELDALVNWFDKNHFDHRGLIPMGAAIDVTGLNIY